jgi:hypothetical protein
LLSDDDPRPLATFAQQPVELGAAYCDGLPVGQGRRAAGSIDRRDQVAFRGQV